MQKIDIDKVLAGKSPRLARRIPRFVVNYLKRIVHQDELNYMIENFGDMSPVDFVRHCLNYMGIEYTSSGMEKLDRNGRYIFASNHPFGGMDGMMLADEVSTYMGDVRVIVNDLLMHIEPLRPIFIPVNKLGRQNSESVVAFREAFASDIPIVTFPAGLCSRKSGGKVYDLPWKANFIKRAVSSHRDVVPVYFDGHLSNFFYRLANIRKKLGIKANIEMVYLVNEMFKQRGSRFTILIGDPVPYTTLNSADGLQQSVSMIKNMVYALKNS